MQGQMTLPTSVENRVVVFGGGPAGATFAATYFKLWNEKVVVVDKNRTLGGIFARLVKFDLNSAMEASVESVKSPSPTRIRPVSRTDDLNYIPNSAHQVRDSGMSEYPDSFAMARAVQRTIREYAEPYTSADLLFDQAGVVFTPGGVPLGRARRIIYAGGLVPKFVPQGAAVMSGYEFLRNPERDLRDKKIAVIGDGATAAQVVELMVGDSYMKPHSLPDDIHWYGGENMPVTKSAWMAQYHARFAGLGRHFPQDGIGGGTIRPFSVRGDVAPAGEIALVNNEAFNLAVYCPGFDPAPCNVAMSSRITLGGATVGLSSGLNSPLGGRVITIGTAAGINESFLPYSTRFPAAANALYVKLPQIAALAAALPR